MADQPSAEASDRAGVRAAFPDWRFAPNIGGSPDIYEIENRALDPAGHVLTAMRQLASWDGRVLVDLGCGTGFWLAGYARDAGRVIGIEPDPALRAKAAARVRGLTGAAVLPGSAEHLPLADRSVHVVHARFAYFLAAASSAPPATTSRAIDGWWRERGATRHAVRSEWCFETRADLESVLRIEFPDAVTDAWLARNPAATRLTYGYVLFCVAA